MEFSPIVVSIVSSDRELLRELTWTLSNCGYSVRASSDGRPEKDTAPGASAELMLIDAREPELAAWVGQEYVDRPTHVIALASDDSASPDKLIMSGCDDVIRYPVNVAELLTRLRCGVRRLEFDRRLAERACRDAASGLFTERGLLARITKAQQQSSGDRTGGLVCFRIDQFNELKDRYGAIEADALIGSLAELVGQHVGDADACAVLGEGRLAAFFNDREDGACLELAKEVALEFTSSDTAPPHQLKRPGVSAVTASIATWEGVRGLLDRTLGALAQVGAYGGGWVGSADELLAELADWRRRFDAGEPFSSVVAQDFMLPFPWVARLEEPMRFSLSRADRRTLPPCLPVVDQDDKLVGVIGPSHLANLNGGPCDPAWIEPTECTIDNNAPLDDVFDLFAGAADGYLLVMDEQRPIGYLSSAGLASLVVDRIDSGAYYAPASEEDDDSTARLVVPADPLSGPK